MSEKRTNLDQLLHDWPYEFGEVAVRLSEGEDGRELLLMRIDMGILQIETVGRPDGIRPHGYNTYYDYLLISSFEEGGDFRLTEERCLEVDREFVQYYHRRTGWLALKEYRQAMVDAEHTLALMDFSSEHTEDIEWAEMHEQYRPFVLFHKVQASVLAELEEQESETAIEILDEGVLEIQESMCQHDEEVQLEGRELVSKLQELRQTIIQHYKIEPSLSDQLAEAILNEEYELAAKLRDRLINENAIL